ncbi:hypothetical protein R5R35_012480 [Gryllus longicercus]|uniref:Uncharacterized protein n=1 Tax=Gryllus longicercus TaxID=2509291 RepID=A0AAN9Z6R3_9ORTH
MIAKGHTSAAAAAAATLLLLLPVLLASAQDAPAPKKVLPSYVPVCKRKDADLSGCVRRAVETLRPRLRKGISRLRVQPLEPFTLPALRVERDLPALRVNASLADIHVDGASDFRIQKLRVDPENLMVSGEVLLPLLRVKCKYAISGRLLTVPLQGRGNFYGNFSDVLVTATGRGKRSNEGGVDHAIATSINLRMRLGGAKVDFDNEDPDSAAAANAALSFVRSNTDAVLEVVTPVAEETAEEVALQMINNIFMRLPFNEILPDA